VFIFLTYYLCKYVTVLIIHPDFGHVRLDYLNKRKLKSNCQRYTKFDNSWFQKLTTIVEMKAR